MGRFGRRAGGESISSTREELSIFIFFIRKARAFCSGLVCYSYSCFCAGRLRAAIDNYAMPMGKTTHTYPDSVYFSFGKSAFDYSMSYDRLMNFVC